MPEIFTSRRDITSLVEPAKHSLPAGQTGGKRITRSAAERSNTFYAFTAVSLQTSAGPRQSPWRSG
jgi:hypothetical protein